MADAYEEGAVIGRGTRAALPDLYSVRPADRSTLDDELLDADVWEMLADPATRNQGMHMLDAVRQSPLLTNPLQTRSPSPPSPRTPEPGSLAEIEMPLPPHMQPPIADVAPEVERAPKPFERDGGIGSSTSPRAGFEEVGLNPEPTQATLADDGEKAKQEVVKEIIQNDASRGGQITSPVAPQFEHFNPAAAEAEGESRYREPETAWVRNLGIDGEGAHKMGQALMRGGAALMSGDADFGTAMGQAINAGLDQWIEADAGITKDKRDRLSDSMDMWKMNQQIDAANADMELRYAQFEISKQEAAHQRLREGRADQRQERADERQERLDQQHTWGSNWGKTFTDILEAMRRAGFDTSDPQVLHDARTKADLLTQKANETNPYAMPTTVQ